MTVRPLQWFSSFWSRMFVSLISAIVIAQTVSLLLLSKVVIEPEIQRFASILARSVAALRLTLDGEPADLRSRTIAQINRQGLMIVEPAGSQPAPYAVPSSLFERVVVRTMAEQMKATDGLDWQVDDQDRFWVKLKIGDSSYWVTTRDRRHLGAWWTLFIISLVSAGAALPVAFLLNRLIGIQLRYLTEASATLAAGQRPGPIELEGPVEFENLAASFNRMSAALDAAERDRTLMLAEISHDIRTPLAKLRLALAMQNSSDPALETTAARQIEEIDLLLGQFIAYARTQAGEEVTDVDLRALLDEIVIPNAANGVTLEAGPGERFAVRGRPMALRSALTNLIENAIRHGKPPVTVTLRNSMDGVDIAVEDHGTGIPEADMAEIRQAFRRGGHASGQPPGAGLGLAIVERVAIAHRGGLRLSNRPEGGLSAAFTIAGFVPRDRP